MRCAARKRAALRQTSSVGAQLPSHTAPPSPHNHCNIHETLIGALGGAGHADVRGPQIPQSQPRRRPSAGYVDVEIHAPKFSLNFLPACPGLTGD